MTSSNYYYNDRCKSQFNYIAKKIKTTHKLVHETEKKQNKKWKYNFKFSKAEDDKGTIVTTRDII